MMTASRSTLAFGLAILLAAACGGSQAPHNDGSDDAGWRDAGPTDTGTPDVGVPDAGDAGQPDAGEADAGPADAGDDAGAPDGGPHDAGESDAGHPDAGCAVPCGTACCGDDEICKDGVCQAACSCQGKQCGSDGCGNSCGTCTGNTVCNDQGRCVACTPEDAATFCSRNHKNCGSYTGLDNCGAERTENCGRCTAPQTCDLQNNVCIGCLPQSNAEFCLAQNTECGPASGSDNCLAPRSVTECGPCPLAGELCQSGRCISCTPTSDRALCAAVNVECGPLAVADDGCGRAKQIGECGPCAGALVCESGACVVPAPANDGCAAPEQLAFNTSGVATTTGDTSNPRTHDDASGTCGGGGSPDLAYKFTVPTGGASSVELAVVPNAGVLLEPAIYLQTSCGQKSSEVANSCVYAPSQGATANLLLPHLAPGTYYAWVDSWGYGTANPQAIGPFTLTATMRAPLAPPASDTCLGPQLLTLDANGHVEVTGDTTWAYDDGGGCLGTTLDGPDVIYELDLLSDATVTATVTRAAGSPNFKPSIILRDAECPGPGADRKCANASGSAGSGSASILALPAGNYYLIVDGQAKTYGGFKLEVQVDEVFNNDDCANARQLRFTNGVALAVGDTRAATNSTPTGSCSSYSGKDLVFRFDLAATSDVDVLMTPTSGSTITPYLYVRTTCADPATEQGCAYVNTPTAGALSLKRLGAGSYYLWTDSYISTTSGRFNLQVTATPSPTPPPNDTCGAPEDVVFDSNGLAIIADRTDASVNDYQGSGSCTDSSGPDRVYKIALGQRASISADIVAGTASPLFKPVLYVRRATCTSTAAADQIDCVAVATSGATGHISRPALEPGDYFLIVDGAARTWGSYALTVKRGPPLDNDTCASPRALTFDATGKATVVGDTSSALDSGTCKTGSGSSGDLVYSFAIADRKDVTITVTPAPGSGLQPVAYLRALCDQRDSEPGTGACGWATAPGDTLVLSRTKLRPGPWYVWVDGWSAGARGAFELSVQLVNSVPPPANDLCRAPTQLVPDSTTNMVTVQGDLTDANDDYVGSCTYASRSPDVVYLVNLPQPSGLVAKVRNTATTSTQLAVYIESACGSTDLRNELACATGAGASATPVTASMPLLAAGNYYVVVDGYLNSAPTTFSLELTVVPPTTNDSCQSGATLLTFNSATGKATASGENTFALDDADGSCGGAGSVGSPKRDLVYKFTTTGTQDVSVTVTPTGTGATLRPIIYLRPSCELKSSELFCVAATAAGGAVSGKVNALPAGDYYLWVDGFSTASGTFNVEVTASAPAATAANDACGTAGANATVLTLPASGVAGSTLAATDNFAGNCGFWWGSTPITFSGPDVVYKFSLAGPTKVIATVTPITAGFKPAVYIRSTCASGSDLDEYACAKSASGGAATATALSAPAGDYYLIVDGLAGTAGDFTLSVSTGTASTVPDACTSATHLPFVNGKARVNASTGPAQHNGESWSCGSSAMESDGPDLVYAVDLSETMLISARLSGMSDGNTAKLYLRNRCGGYDPINTLACDSSGSTTAAGLAVASRALLPGTYYLWVENYWSDSGANFGSSFQLDVAIARPNPADVCNLASALVPMSGSVSVVGDTSLSVNDANASCGSGAAGGELFYSFTLASDRAVDLTVFPASGSTAQHVLYVRDGCGASSIELACAAATAGGGQVAVSLPVLPQGTYYVAVDGIGPRDMGQFTLSLGVSTPSNNPPPNDTCTVPTPLSVNTATGKATATGATTWAHDSNAGTCGGTAGSDVVYGFTLASASKVTAVVARDAASATFKPVVYLRRTCADAAATNELSCATDTSGTATLVVNTLPAGDYFLIVDGAAGTRGGFTLDLTLDAAMTGVPAGESCGLAQPLVFGGANATASGMTAYGASEATGSCAIAGAPDVVYGFSLAQDSSITAVVTPSAQSGVYRPAVYLRRSCGSAAMPDELACGVADNAGYPATAFVPRAVAGTYYVWVDGGGSSVTSGFFTLDVALGGVVAAPANDVCANAVPVARFASVTGTTVSASDDIGDDALSPGCDPAGTKRTYGPDVVYSYTPSSTGMFRVDLFPVNFDGAIIVTTGSCAASACVGYKNASASKGTSEYINVAGVAGTTYYIIVDGATRGDSGSFRIKVQ